MKKTSTFLSFQIPHSIFLNYFAMKKALLLILSVLLFNCTKAQVNLVPNPSFELHDTCPNTDG
jgi:hypothetical protein